jgi:predicted Zn-dependent peptidase
MRPRSISAATACAVIAAALVPMSSLAQHAAPQPALDRSVVPSPGPPPPLHVPSWTKVRLDNGAELMIVVKRDLPLVAFSVDFIGGSTELEPADKVGVAAFTAQMLSEGTTTRSADQLSDAQQLLGTSIAARVGGETGSIGFEALANKLPDALTLLVDMLVHPTFPPEALERIRARTLVQLAQAKEEPNRMAADVFSRVVFGAAHPYGRVLTERTARAITRDDVVAFHKAYFQPGRAVISVAGDVDPARLQATVAAAMKAWPAGGQRPSFSYPEAPQSRPTTIYLVDKPKAAQSVFALGLPGPPRSTPDYYPLVVMNTLLGGMFQSRLNHNIREVKGYSYGVRSSFAFGRGPGPFDAGGGIVTANTKDALVEFLKELKGVQGAIPFTEGELKEGKDSLVQGLPRRFASVGGIAGAVAGIYTQGLPETFYQDYAKNIAAVTAADLVRVARKYIDLDHLNIVIVGDRAAVEASLRESGIAPVVVLDAEANPVAAASSAAALLDLRLARQ